MRKANLIKNSVLLFSVIALVASIVAFASGIFAWFVLMKDNDVDVFTVEVLDKRLLFNDSVKVKRILPGETNEYTFVRGESLPLILDSLVPGEAVDIEITLYSEQNIDDYNYVLGFRGMSATTFTDADYSFLGLFHINSLQLNEFGVLEPVSPDKWLASYGEGANTLSEIIIRSNLWSNDKIENNTVKINFRITFDLSQLQEVYGGDLTNILTGQSVHIKSLYCNLM